MESNLKNGCVFQIGCVLSDQLFLIEKYLKNESHHTKKAWLTPFQPSQAFYSLLYYRFYSQYQISYQNKAWLGWFQPSLL